jgi:hypothetical protein
MATSFTLFLVCCSLGQLDCGLAGGGGGGQEANKKNFFWFHAVAFYMTMTLPEVGMFAKGSCSASRRLFATSDRLR